MIILPTALVFSILVGSSEDMRNSANWRHAKGSPGYEQRQVGYLAVATAQATQPSGVERESEGSRPKVVATMMWLVLAILSVLFLGIGLIWGVSRGAKRLLRRHGPYRTEMPDIWFENPPEKRRRQEP